MPVAAEPFEMRTCSGTLPAGAVQRRAASVHRGSGVADSKLKLDSVARRIDDD